MLFVSYDVNIKICGSHNARVRAGVTGFSCFLVNDRAPKLPKHVAVPVKQNPPAVYCLLTSICMKGNVRSQNPHTT